MSISRAASYLVRFFLLFVVFAVSFTAGSAIVPSSLAPPDVDADRAAIALLVVAALDTVILGAIALSTRLRGWRAWALLASFQWFVMTVTSQLEALYFMPNVTREMAPWLFAMTLPVSIAFPAVAMLAFGLWRRDSGVEPAWRGPGLSGRQTLGRVTALSLVVYPTLFFAAGYFIAWQDPAVREFYTGSTALVGPVEHFTTLLASDPLVYPFEALRGLLWVAAALPVLRTTRGPWWWGTLLVALAFCFVQNDLHLLPNPLMPSRVSLTHFLETGTSNFVWAFTIGWLLARPLSSAPPLSGRFS